MGWVLELWSYLTSVDGAKFLSAIAACVTILSGGYAFLKAYRYGESQIAFRLAEYLAREETRLETARERLGDLVQRPEPSQAIDAPAFLRRALLRALRRMGWGWWRPEEQIASVAARCEQQATLARRQARIHSNELLLSHLLLGAIADANGDHATAFAEFEKALKLDETDVQALEYAGLQLLKLSNFVGAAQHFEKLAVIAEQRGDHLLLARAYRQQAIAHEQLGGLVQANQELIWSMEALPANAEPLEVARSQEQHGRVRGKLGYANANESYQNALVIYSGLKDIAAGREGLERVTAALEALNRRSTVASANPPLG